MRNHLIYPLIIILILHLVGCKKSNKHTPIKTPAKAPHKEVQFTIPPYHGGTNLENVCQKLKNVAKRKEIVASKLKAAVEKLSKNQEKDGESSEPADSQRIILNIFSKQLNYNEQIIYQTIDWLTQSLAGQFKDYRNMKVSIETRLKALRDATFQEEQCYHQLLLAEKDINRTKELNQAQDFGGILGEILSQLAESADELVEDLGDNLQEDDAMRQRILGKNGENIEALVRMDSEDEDIQRLADANGNQFVLSRSQDSTRPHEDITLLLDMVYIMVGSACLSYMSSLLGLPIMFGQVLCGIILGPSALNILSSLVQLETLAELGVFFIMFSVGLEFTPLRIRQIIRISILGSFGLMALLVLFSILLSLVISSSTLGECAFIGACFSLSSTPLVIKFTAPTQAQTGMQEEAKAARTEYSEVLLGILVLQDVLMGMLVAFLPTLAGHGTILSSLGLLGHIIFAFLSMTLLSVLVVKLLQRLETVLLLCSSELLTLISTGLAFIMMWVSTSSPHSLF
ncbi:transmembrane and coiled-coil domain-containing protein 3-like isoform X2 [Watersipora subatra]|uniref:transmembrane and coiled-coil domain-containing protein 3-like isoform X2 n=1 Tax=Watersipora subatra TaxID=2589382 RepID=UPI00355BEE6E